MKKGSHNCLETPVMAPIPQKQARNYRHLILFCPLLRLAEFFADGYFVNEEDGFLISDCRVNLYRDGKKLVLESKCLVDFSAPVRGNQGN